MKHAVTLRPITRTIAGQRSSFAGGSKISGIVASGIDIPRPDAEDRSASEEVSEHQQRVAALFDALTGDLPPEPKNRTPEQAACWLLAHALDWHRREDKVKWWESVFKRGKSARVQTRPPRQ